MKKRQSIGRVMFSNTLMTLSVISLLVLIVICWLVMPKNDTETNEEKTMTPKVSTGKIEQHADMPSRYVSARTVTVWMPDGYEVGDTCSVVYMHDGNMLFDASMTWNKQEWKADEVFGQLIADGSIGKCIIVGIDNNMMRLSEYFPARCCEYVADEELSGKNVKSFLGDAYLRFMVEELKPFIDERYKPLTDASHTYVMGSSMGGLISLYALCEYPSVFGGAACMSSHLSMEGLHLSNQNAWAEGFCDYVKEHLPATNSRKIYMDRGTETLDAGYASYQEKMDEVFRHSGWDDTHFQSKVFEGARHSESDWSKRLHEPVKFLLGG